MGQVVVVVGGHVVAGAVDDGLVLSVVLAGVSCHGVASLLRPHLRSSVVTCTEILVLGQVDVAIVKVM